MESKGGRYVDIPFLPPHVVLGEPHDVYMEDTKVTALYKVFDDWYRVVYRIEP
jgi:hypothetical protein